MKRILHIIFLSTIGFTNALAQDAHFSQTEFAPLLLNPALAGASSRIQVIANYRNQWNSVASPYQTIAASFDARFQRRYSDRNSFLAAGLSFYNDQAGDMKVTTNQFNLDLAYHIKMGRQSVFRIGLYGGMNQRVLTPGRGNWASQYNGIDFDQGVSSGENLGSYNHSFFDAGAGVVYTYRKMKYTVNSNVNNNVNAGFSVYHVNQPASSFVSLPQDRLFMRFSAFVNSSFNLGRSPMTLQPALYVHIQAKYYNVMFGTYVRYNIREQSHMTGSIKSMAAAFGVFYRYNDALVAKGYFELDKFSVGMAYDANFSRLTPASGVRGGFELFLRFVLADRLNNPHAW